MGSAADWWARKLSGATTSPTPGSAQYPTTGPPPPIPPFGQPSGFLDAAARWQGSEAAQRTESGHCPECGSGNYFARKRSEQGMPMRAEAAPHCFDCGYPVVQAGSSRGSAATARPSGPAKQARQLPSGHAVQVVADGGTQTFTPRG